MVLLVDIDRDYFGLPSEISHPVFFPKKRHKKSVLLKFSDKLRLKKVTGTKTLTLSHRTRDVVSKSRDFRHNQNLPVLSVDFESINFINFDMQMFAEYDDTEVGALDLEEIEGFMPESHDMLLRAAEDFEESQRRYHLDKEKEIARFVVYLSHTFYVPL